jgi:electron transport complex protein RnfB
LHDGSADINQCPPGGATGVRRLAELTGRPAKPLNPDNGTEGPRSVVFIDEAWCIGCTLCIKACPVDANVGANKLMHTVIEPYCTGCELCLPVCPVDCIEIENVTGSATGWDAWSQEQAAQARQRYEFHMLISQREALENAQRLETKAELKLSDLAAHSQHTDPAVLDKKRAVIEAALARARARREAAP